MTGQGEAEGTPRARGRRWSWRACICASGLPCSLGGGTAPAMKGLEVSPLAGYICNCSTQFSQTTFAELDGQLAAIKSSQAVCSGVAAGLVGNAHALGSACAS